MRRFKVVTVVVTFLLTIVLTSSTTSEYFSGTTGFAKVITAVDGNYEVYATSPTYDDTAGKLVGIHLPQGMEYGLSEEQDKVLHSYVATVLMGF